MYFSQVQFGNKLYFGLIRYNVLTILQTPVVYLAMTEFSQTDKKPIKVTNLQK